MEDDELMARELSRILRLIQATTAACKRGDKSRYPASLRTAADQTMRAQQALRVSLDCARAAKDTPTGLAWSALVMAALQAGVAAGATLIHEERSAGNAKRSGTAVRKRRDVIEVLAAQPSLTAAELEAEAAKLHIEPESLSRGIRRRRQKRTQ